MRSTKAEPVECWILGFPASVNMQIGIPTHHDEQPEVRFDKPSDGAYFEVEFAVAVLSRVLDKAIDAVSDS